VRKGSRITMGDIGTEKKVIILEPEPRPADAPEFEPVLVPDREAVPA
jgi:hypothetical protein